MVDSNGFRANVGIILCNQEHNLLWAKRIGQESWQFPQGGVKRHESLQQALFRELNEEVGLNRDDVEIIGSTRNWLRYRLPRYLIRYHKRPLCIGQKQRWYLLRLTSNETRVCLDRTEQPEFESWRWVNYWHPLREVVFFKRKVYACALHELAPLLKTNKSLSKTATQPHRLVNTARVRRA